MSSIKNCHCLEHIKEEAFWKGGLTVEDWG